MGDDAPGMAKLSSSGSPFSARVRREPRSILLSSSEDAPEQVGTVTLSARDIRSLIQIRCRDWIYVRYSAVDCWTWRALIIEALVVPVLRLRVNASVEGLGVKAYSRSIP